MTFWVCCFTTLKIYCGKLHMCQMWRWPLCDWIKLSYLFWEWEVLVNDVTCRVRGRVWWRAGRMTAGTVVITGGILATVILLCIIAVLCYCRLQVCLLCLCVCGCVCESGLSSTSVLILLPHCIINLNISSVLLAARNDNHLKYVEFEVQNNATSLVIWTNKYRSK